MMNRRRCGALLSLVLCAALLAVASNAEDVVLEPFHYEYLQADIPTADAFNPFDVAPKADAIEQQQQQVPQQAAFPFEAPPLPADLIRSASSAANPRFRELVAEQLQRAQVQKVRRSIQNAFSGDSSRASIQLPPVHEITRAASSLPSAEQIVHEVAPQLKLAEKKPVSLVEASASVSRAETHTEALTENGAAAKAEARHPAASLTPISDSSMAAAHPTSESPAEMLSPMTDAAAADAALKAELQKPGRSEADSVRFASEPIPISNTNTVTTTNINGAAPAQEHTTGGSPSVEDFASSGAATAAASAASPDSSTPAAGAPSAGPASESSAPTSGSLPADSTSQSGSAAADQAGKSQISPQAMQASAVPSSNSESGAAAPSEMSAAASPAESSALDNLPLDEDPQIAELQRQVAAKQKQIGEDKAWVERVREIVREYEKKLFNVNAHIHAEERDVKRTKANIASFIKHRKQRKLSLELQAALDALSKLEGDSSNLSEKVNKLHSSRAALRATVRRIRLALGRDADARHDPLDTNFLESMATATTMSETEKMRLNEHAKGMLSSLLEELDEIHPVVASALESKYDGKIPPIPHSTAAAKIDPYIKQELLQQELDRTLKETDELTTDLQ